MRLIFTDLLLNKILPTPCKDVPIDSNIAGTQRNSNFNEEGSGHTPDGRAKFQGQKFNGTRQQSRRGGNKAVERRREACAAKLRGRSDEIVVVTVYTYYS
jgi:hypothetical protein